MKDQPIQSIVHKETGSDHFVEERPHGTDDPSCLTFEQKTEEPQDPLTLCLANSTRRRVIQDHGIRPQLPRQNDGFGLSPSDPTAQTIHGRSITYGPPRNPFRLSDLSSPWPSRTLVTTSS